MFHPLNFIFLNFSVPHFSQPTSSPFDGAPVLFRTSMCAGEQCLCTSSCMPKISHLIDENVRCDGPIQTSAVTGNGIVEWQRTGIISIRTPSAVCDAECGVWHDEWRQMMRMCLPMTAAVSRSVRSTLRRTTLPAHLRLINYMYMYVTERSEFQRPPRDSYRSLDRQCYCASYEQLTIT